MARYIGPTCKLSRREGTDLYLKSGVRPLDSKCKADTVPGVHGARRSRLSDYGLQLREKQKVRRIYGILERQFRNYYKEATRLPGVSGENLVRLLETRLDNAFYRAGFADSRIQARQVVRHGLVSLNGRKLDIPSAHVKIGDVITFTPRGGRSEFFKIAKDGMRGKNPPSWLSVDAGQMTFRVLAEPAIAHGESHLFNENVVIEYYSR